MRMRQLFGAKNGGCNQVNARVGFVLIKPVRFSEFFWCTFISTSIYGVIEGNDCPKLDFEELIQYAGLSAFCKIGIPTKVKCRNVP